MDYARLSDNDLLQMFAEDHDEKVFQILHKRFHNELRGFLFKDCKVFGSDINDILQDVWVRVIQKAHLYDPNYSARNWLYRVSERVVLTNWTHKSVQKRGGPNIQEFNMFDEEIHHCIENRIGDPLQILLDEEQRKQVQEILAQLPSEEQQAVNLVYLQGLKYREAAVILKTSKDIIKGQLSRAKVQLRWMLADLVRH